MHCSVKGSCQSILKYFLQDYNYQLFYQMCVCRCPAEKPKWVFITKEAAVVYRIRSTRIGILYGSVTELSSQCIISLSQAAYVEWSCDLSQCRTHWDPLCEQLPWVVGDTKAGRRWFSNSVLAEVESCLQNRVQSDWGALRDVAVPWDQALCCFSCRLPQP